MHWFDAALYCKSKGGNLVEIDSEEENTALVAVQKSKRGTSAASGSEDQTWKLRALGAGQTAAHGISLCGTQNNQTTSGGLKIA